MSLAHAPYVDGMYRYVPVELASKIGDDLVREALTDKLTAWRYLQEHLAALRDRICEANARNNS